MSLRASLFMMQNIQKKHTYVNTISPYIDNFLIGRFTYRIILQSNSCDYAIENYSPSVLFLISDSTLRAL